MRQSLFIIWILLVALPSRAQTPKIDSLKRNIAGQSSDPQRLKAILALCSMGYNLHGDTLTRYAMEAYQLAKTTQNKTAAVEARYYEASALTNKGQIDSSLSMIESCLNDLKSLPDNPSLKVRLLNQKGRCYMRKNLYKDAIQMGYEIIRISEKEKLILDEIKGRTLIGWAYTEMGQTHDAVHWHQSAINATKDTALLNSYGILYANIAINYDDLDKMDSAFYYINKAVAASRSYGNLFALSNALAIQAQLLVKDGKTGLAESPLKEAVSIRKLIEDPFYIVSDMAQLGFYYANTHQYEKGIAVCHEGIAMARKYHLTTKLVFLYSSLAENYKAVGNLDQYAATLETILQLKDTVYEINSSAALADLIHKYDRQRNETIIAQQKYDIVTKNFLFYGSLLLLVLGGIIVWLLFRNSIRKNRMRMLLMQEKEKRNSLLAVKDAEEKERKRIAADLHDSLGSYAASIKANVEDMVNVPDIARSNLDLLQTNSQQMVSLLGDTIWALRKESLKLSDISDRIKVFLQRLRTNYPKIKMLVEEQLDHDLELQPNHAYHLFMIVQEAVNNALKHSRGDEIIVTICSIDTFFVSIADNGNGMHQGGASREGGNGKHNMQARAAAMDCFIEWRSREPYGTEVIIQPIAS